MTFIRLSIMMFFQFFVWGAWYVTAPNYLGTIGFGGGDFGWTYSVGPIAGIITPFFVGMIADRFFATERLLGVLHLAGGGLMLLATRLMVLDTPSPLLINLVFFLYMLTYYPTLSLTNTLAMHNMKNSEKEFPLIRVFGTIGWIAAGITLSVIGWGSTIGMFYLTSGVALFLGVYSFVLPHTPPPAAGKKAKAGEMLGLGALFLLKQRSFLIFMVSSFLICIPLAFYYQLAARTVTAGELANPAFKMTFGQMSEILFMLLMPLFFARLGVKWMLFVGMLAWVARYALFAIGAPDAVAWMILLGVALHGICYDFFFVTGQIYTDKVADKKIRGQAQGMLVLFTLGLGMLIGAQIAGKVETTYTPPETGQWLAESGDIGTLAGERQTSLDEAMAEDGAPSAESVDDAFNKIADPFSAGALGLVTQIKNHEDAKQIEYNESVKSDEAIKALRDEIVKLNEELGNATAGSAEAKKISDDVTAKRLEQSNQMAALAMSQHQSELDAIADEATRERVTEKIQIARLNGYKDQIAIEAYQAMDWKMIWLIPCAFAGLIMLIFAVAFRDDTKDDSDEDIEAAEEKLAENE